MKRAAPAPRRPLQATFRARGVVLIGSAAFSAVAIWAVHHVLVAMKLVNGDEVHRYAPLYLFMYGMLTWQMVLAYLERPRHASPRAQERLDRKNVAAIIPAYNEDPAALQACINSLLCQSRPPDTIVVSDDGSDLSQVDYGPVHRWFAQLPEMRTRLRWIRSDVNQGKREAQAAAVLATPEADFYYTSDSDTLADRWAMERMLQPMANKKVQSVAGVVVATNTRSAFLTRLHDLLFVTSQLVDRSALSTLGVVWVNSGPIALYRAAILRDNLDSYLTETFFSRGVKFSDDSMLTLYAMMRGRTVQQPDAIAFALMPETFSQNWRMYLRWMRGSFIRSWWRVRYLRLWSPAWWMHTLRWIATVVSLIVAVDVLLIKQIAEFNPAVFAWSAGVTVAVAYAQTLRYLLIKRTDQSLAYQLGTWALAPVAVLWQMTVLRVCRLVAVATVMRGGWGTRQKVEVTMAPATR